MLPLLWIIIWLAIAGSMMMIGAAITVRRYFDAQQDRIVIEDVTEDE